MAANIKVVCARCKTQIDVDRIGELVQFKCRACEVRAPMCAGCHGHAQKRDRGMCYECKDAQQEMKL